MIAIERLRLGFVLITDFIETNEKAFFAQNMCA
jgi:hypothetical protein